MPSDYITPKNWLDLQHYKDRNPPWIRLHKSLLDNYEFHRLQVASRALAPMLWLLASCYEGGKIPADVDALSFRLRMSRDELISSIRPLILAGFFDFSGNASNPLAPCKQDAIPETETETKRETETEAKKSTRGSRLSADFVLPKEWEDWAKQERPDLNLQSVGEQFRDYWSAKAGSGSTKLDWQATWRNWVRNQKQVFKQTDLVRTTVPSSSQRDPALVKLDEDYKNSKPNPEILAKIKEALRGKVA